MSLYHCRLINFTTRYIASCSSLVFTVLECVMGVYEEARATRCLRHQRRACAHVWAERPELLRGRCAAGAVWWVRAPPRTSLGSCPDPLLLGLQRTRAW